MATINISLTDAQKQFVDEEAATGQRQRQKAEAKAHAQHGLDAPDVKPDP